MRTSHMKKGSGGKGESGNQERRKNEINFGRTKKKGESECKIKRKKNRKSEKRREQR